MSELQEMSIYLNGKTVNLLCRGQPCDVKHTCVGVVMAILNCCMLFIAKGILFSGGFRGVAKGAVAFPLPAISGNIKE